MVIDDNAINRTILTEQLTGWGHECVAVESGPVGLRFLEYAAQQHQVPVDLVVLDFHMPEMNGADVVRAIRRTTGISDTAIMILSSVDQANELEQLSDANVQGHVSKPARSKLLKSTINSILNRRSLRQNVSEVARQDTLSSPRVEAEPKASVKEPIVSPFEDEVKISPDDNQIDRLTVLVAEDNPVNQIVFSEALKQNNLDFEIANDGREAVTLWRQKLPKVIVMDVSMPHMNGHEATREIRRIEKEEGLSHTPIIAVTAHAMKTDQQNCFDAGMDDYMTKPISPEMLNAKITNWLEDHNASSASVKRA